MNKLQDDFLRPFNEQQRSMLLTLALEADTFGLELSEVIALLRASFEAQRPAGGLPAPGPLPPTKKPVVCPACGAPVVIRPVNVSRCTNIGGAWQTSLECSNNACRYTELSLLALTDWRRP